MDSRIIYDFVVAKIIGTKKQTQGGWLSFNGSCCIHNGEGKSDTRKRCGIRISPDHKTIIHCFNCSYVASWTPGRSIGKRLQSLLQWMGTTDEEYKKLHFKVWQLKENADALKPVKEWFNFTFPDKELPVGAETFAYWASQNSHSSDFINVVEYTANRGSSIFENREYYWCPDTTDDLNRRVIIPFKWNDKVIGWTGRAIFPTKYRYFSSVPTNYLFNTNVIRPEHEYIIVCEGVFDAIAVNGIATLGNHVSTDQIKWLNDTGKKIIVVPDREPSGDALINAAISANWYVCFPKWDSSIKDAADASKYYGKLYAIWSIISTKTNNRLQIDIERVRDLKNIAMNQ